MLESFRAFIAADVDLDGKIGAAEFDMMIESAAGLPRKFGYSWSISNPLPLKHFLKVPFGIQLVTRVVNLGNRPLTSLLCPHFVNLRWDEGSYSDEADRIASHEQLFRVSN